MRKFFTNNLRNRLVASFFFLGIFSAIISTYIVVRMNTAQLQRQMRAALIEASEKTLKTTQDFKSASAGHTELLLRNAEFLYSLMELETATVYRTGNPLIIWLPGAGEQLRYGKDIFKLEKPEALIAGYAAAVRDGGGRYRGNLLVGYELGKSFAQEMSLFTNVEINILYRKDAEISPDKIGLEMEESFSAGEPYYHRDAEFQGVKYEAYYSPLITADGGIAGIIFAGIPKSFGFSEIVGTWRFFPILIALAAVMAGGLGYAVAGFISKPITVFTNGVLEVAGGNLNHQIHIDATEEMAELSRAFNHMTEKLRELRRIEQELVRKERLAALGEMSAGIAHEIRNPLGIIKSSAQILKNSRGQNSKTKELTDFIIDETERLNRVITNLLDFARPQALDTQENRLETVIDRSLRTAGEALRERAVRLSKKIKPGPAVPSDAEILSQAFSNLLLNSAEAMPGGGEITIETDYSAGGEEKGWASVRISDTGCGISDGIKGKIFNPFFSTKENGTGLGLSIVHKIIEMHGGRISVESSAGKGAVFNIKLPLS